MTEVMKNKFRPFVITDSFFLCFDLHSVKKLFHRYANKPMQYTAIFHGCKNVNFQMKNNNSLLIFAQNIDCEKLYTPVNPS